MLHWISGSKTSPSSEEVGVHFSPRNEKIYFDIAQAVRQVKFSATPRTYQQLRREGFAMDSNCNLTNLVQRAAFKDAIKHIPESGRKEFVESCPNITLTACGPLPFGGYQYINIE